VIKNANIRFGPDMKFPVTDSFPKGYPLEILAKSTHEPLWLKTKGLKGGIGWIFSELVNCGNTNLAEVESEGDPLIPKPTRDPNKKPDDDDSRDCNPNLTERECIAAGGTWSPSTTSAGYCICP
jgi:hypothetical protein